MGRITKLSNAPVFEALLDFRFNVPEGVGEEELKILCSLLTPDFPGIEIQHEFETFFELKGSADAHVNTKRSFSGFILRNPEKTKALLVRRNGCTASQIGGYSSWEDLEQQAGRLFEAFVKSTGAEGVTRIAARFVNHIPLTSDAVDLDDLLVHGPKVPKGVSEHLFQFESKVGIIERPSGLQAVLSVALAEPSPTIGRLITIDSDVFKVGSFEPVFSSLLGTLGEIRDLKNRIFFGSLTDHALEPFR